MLAKERRRRYQHVGDVRIDLGELIQQIESPVPHSTLSAGGEASRTSTVATSWRRMLPVALALALGFSLALAFWSYLRSLSPPQSPIRFRVAAPPLAVLEHAPSPVVALSPDGTHVAYAAGDAGAGQLYLRRLDLLEAQPITAAVNAQGPFFSPDGRWIAFFAGGKLKKVSIEGGPPVSLCDTPGPTHGGSWGINNTIVFPGPGGLWHVSADGGNPEALTKPNSEKRALLHFWPEFLPGGDVVLFTASDGAGGTPSVWAQHIKTGQRRLLVQGGGNARFLPPGLLVYAWNGSLMSAAFDVERLEITGPAVPVIEGIMMGLPLEPWLAHFAVSANGTLVYLPGPFLPMERTLVWLDGAGEERPLNIDSRPHRWPRISPDGTRIALEVREGGNQDVWIYNLARETLTRLTFHPSDDERPLWTPDGRRIIFRSNRDDGGWNLFWKAADGTGPTERLTEHANADRVPWCFTPDGKEMVFTQINPGTGIDLHVMSMENKHTYPLFQKPLAQTDPMISPDGRWIVFRSEETGRSEIYVRPFPRMEEGVWQIPSDGGISPVWSSGGRRLFYRGGEARDTMMIVPIESGSTFAFRSPEVWFTGTYYYSGGRNYDISPDGKAFLMIKEGRQALDGSTREELVVVLNWLEELKRLTPWGIR